MKACIRKFALVVALLALSLRVPVRADVNFMVYMIGGDLEEMSCSATADILEMLLCDEPEGVNLYAMAGGSRSWALSEADGAGTTSMRVRKGQIEVLEREEDGASATDAALSRFLKACAGTTPAGENILVLWGHGCEGALGVGYDSLRGDDTLTLEEIRRGIEAGGVAVDILGFDACGMATDAVAAELRDCCGCLLASEREVATEGWPYRQVIGALTGDADLDRDAIIGAVNRNAERKGWDGALEPLF